MPTELPYVPSFTPAAQHQPPSMLQPIDNARSILGNDHDFVNLPLSRKFTYPVLEQHGTLVVHCLGARNPSGMNIALR
jgi:hypothetical protein